MKRMASVLAATLLLAYAEDSLNVRTVAARPYSDFYLTLTLEALDSTAIIGLYGGLWFADFSSQSPPVKLSEYITGGAIRDMVLKDSLLYVADGERGFRIFDVSSIPEVREVAAVSDRAYWRVIVADTLAYLSQFWSFALPGAHDTIEVFNVRDPTNPRRLHAFCIRPGFVYCMSVIGDRLYVAAHYGGLKIFDVSNPTNPVLIGEWPSPDDYPRWVVARDSLAYVAGNDTLRILNAADPGNITELGKVRLSRHSPDLHEITRFVLSDTLLYAVVEDESGSCVVVNVANPLSPRVVSRTPEVGGFYALKLAGSTIITGELKGATFYDASNPCSLKLLGRVELPSICTRVRARDSLAFVSLESHGHLILDVSQPPRVRERGRYPRTWTYPPCCFTIPALRDSLVFTGFLDTNFLYVLNAANPDSIFCIGSCSLGPRPLTAVRAVFLTRSITGMDLAYVACTNWMGVAICDVSDPHNPVLLSRTEIPGGSADCYNVVVQDNFAYAACGPAGLWIIEVSDPVRPRLRGHLPSPEPGYAVDVAVRDSLVFLADSYLGLRVVNAKNPDNPYVAYVIDGYGQQMIGVWLEQDLLYLGNGRAGLRIYDISDISSPREVGHYRSSGIAEKLHVCNGLIHLAEDVGGYRCLQYYGPSPGVGDTTAKAKPTTWRLTAIPSPSRSKVTVEFSVPTRCSVTVKLCDIAGRNLGSLFAGAVLPGTSRLELSTEKLPAGAYFVVLETGGATQQARFTVP